MNCSNHPVNTGAVRSCDIRVRAISKVEFKEHPPLQLPSYRKIGSFPVAEAYAIVPFSAYHATIPTLRQLTLAGYQLYAAAEKVATASQELAESLGVPEELRLKMVRYASELRRKHPNMKPARVQRKVAEHFKIKLV